MENPRWTAIVGWALIVAGLLFMIVSAVSSSSIDPDTFQETQGARGGSWMSFSDAGPFIAGMGVLIVAINKRLRLERVLQSLSVGIVGWLLVAPAGATFSCLSTASGENVRRDFLAERLPNATSRRFRVGARTGHRDCCVLSLAATARLGAFG